MNDIQQTLGWYSWRQINLHLNFLRKRNKRIQDEVPASMLVYRPLTINTKNQ